MVPAGSLKWSSHAVRFSRIRLFFLATTRIRTSWILTGVPWSWPVVKSLSLVVMAWQMMSGLLRPSARPR